MNNENNRYFSDNYHYAGTNQTETSISLTYYNKDIVKSVKVEPATQSFATLVKDDCINWFRVEGLQDAASISRMIKEFRMHSLDARDILTPDHVVKIDDSDNYIFVVLNNCTFNAKNRIFSEHICFIVKGNIVMSFTESDKPIFRNVEVGLKSNTMDIRNQKSGMLLAFLLNPILVDMIETAGRIEKTLEKMEDILLENHYNQGNVGFKIQQCRHAYLILRKNTQPLKCEFSKLMQEKDGIIDMSTLPVFNDLSDQLEYIVQTAENSRDMLSSLVDLYVSNNDLKANEIMKHLTVVATIFIPITFLVGVWGMNFDFMPELDWRYGYLFAWIIILIAGIGTWVLMKKKKWF